MGVVSKADMQEGICSLLINPRCENHNMLAWNDMGCRTNHES